MTPRFTRDQLAWAAATQGGPEMPAKPKPRKKSTRPERPVMRAVLAALRMHPRVAWAARMNTGVARYGQHGDRMVRFGTVGMSDFIGQLPDGRFMAVECKAAGGRASPAQQAFLARVNTAGGIAFVAKSVEDVSEYLEGGTRQTDTS